MPLLTGFEKIVRQQELLAPHTWFGLGGNAEFFAEPNSLEELAALVRRAQDEQLPVRILGGGSNILVRDEGVKGVVVRLSAPAFLQLRAFKHGVSAGGGVKLGQLISLAVREGFGGLESLVGIPGTVGGALHGNAGGQSGDIGQFTQRATVLTRRGEILVRERKDLVFASRQSSLDELVILDAEFVMERENPEELTKRMQKQWIMKKAVQPMGHQNTGQIFKNPRGVDAGQLIEQAGLKGARVGNVEVNDRHANFFVAEPAATTAEVLRLIDFVRDKVLERVGVELELEIEIW
ncbi:MAG: UDP-N-acetylmuramate dehydrogenase [Pirellulales bacterium]|nr:UDP-N-acetylmuramate dehydrogenase [Pirellulales bacterium]